MISLAICFSFALLTVSILSSIYSISPFPPASSPPPGDTQRSSLYLRRATHPLFPLFVWFLFLFKLLEKICFKQLNFFLLSNNLILDLQSDFRCIAPQPLFFTLSYILSITQLYLLWSLLISPMPLTQLITNCSWQNFIIMASQNRLFLLFALSSLVVFKVS